jgi:glutathione S-transferase
MKREPADKSACGYGTFDDMFNTMMSQLSKGPYMLGEKFTAVDVLWGAALGWMSAFDLLPKRQEITDYVARVQGRPAAVAAAEKDQELAAAQAA